MERIDFAYRNLICISPELQKAFYIFDLGVFLEKIKCFGLRTSVIKWFKSYLLNRIFLVCIYVFSEAGTLQYGVPQGSILGPPLFLLYVNDLPQSLSEACFYFYENETCIFYQHEDVKNIENVLNEEFSSLRQWFIENKLSIHFRNKIKLNPISFQRREV